MQKEDQYMTGKSGVYATDYANHRITVKLFDAPELTQSSIERGTYQAIVTYRCLDSGHVRQDLDTLTHAHVDYCRKVALEIEEKNGEKPWGQLFGSYMAQVYWTLIQ
jgi:hypothetical protein